MLVRTLPLLLLLEPIVAPLPPGGNPSFCQYLGRTPYGLPNDPNSCVEECMKLCTKSPGEYFCQGKHVHTDTTDKKFNQDSNVRYNYCLCTRTVTKRTPGKYCGPDELDLCDTWDIVNNGFKDNVGPEQIIDGYNNIVEGFQGQRLLDIIARQDEGVEDKEPGVTCDPNIQKTLRYMFN